MTYRSVGDDNSGVLFTQPLYSNTGVPFTPAVTMPSMTVTPPPLSVQLTPDQFLQAIQQPTPSAAPAPTPAQVALLNQAAIRTAKPRYACPAGQQWTQVVDKMSGAVVWKCTAAPPVTVSLITPPPESTPAPVVPVYAAAPVAPPAATGMSTTEMILIGVGGVAVLGIGYVLLKKK